jgi:hypothetical protein
MSEPVTANVDCEIRLVDGPVPDPNVTLQFCLEKNILGIGGCRYCSGLTPGIRNYDLEPGSANDPGKSERCDEERLIGGLVRRMLQPTPVTGPE